MVQSIEIPLKATDEAIVNFLLKVVFAQRKPNTLSSRRECLQHDVFGACQLISWIVRNDKRNPRSLIVACNLVYGNTIVLSHQVTRLLSDASRARELVAFTSYLAEEEERRRRTREQMEQGLDDDGTTPKKKRRSKTAVAGDDYLMTPATPISIALRQDITMPDAHFFQRDDNILMDDDLPPPSDEQYEMLYGMLDSDHPNLNTNQDLTFVDRFSSSHHRREDALNETLDFQRPRIEDVEFERPRIDDIELDRPSNEFIRNQQETPAKNNYGMPQDEEMFEPHANLAYILRFGRLPFFGEGEQRRSMEDEMEDARHHGIHAQSDTPTLQVPRVPSGIELDEDLIIPPNLMTPKTPRTPRRLVPAVFNHSGGVTPSPAENRFRIPLREMNEVMEDFSSLHHKHPSAFRSDSSRKRIPAKELLSTVPYFLRNHCSEDILGLFPTRGTLFERNLGTNVSISEDIEDEEEEEEDVVRFAQQNLNSELLEPINLSTLKFKETQLKEKSPCMSPLRPVYEYEELPIEQVRREDYFDPPLQTPVSPMRMEDPLDPMLVEEPFHFAKSLETPYSGSNSEDKTPATIRENLFKECENAAPYSFQLDQLLINGPTSRREAARTFYVVLELLKERAIKATQITPYGPIDMIISGHDSEDLTELAQMDMDDGDF